jgi:protoporphyrinogen oxidase
MHVPSHFALDSTPVYKKHPKHSLQTPIIPQTHLLPTPIVILGAGPGGLTAAYWLLRHGIPVTILEKEAQAGGLMRAVRHGDFVVDLGFKHLYNRIPEVHALWTELLGDDFLPYVPRTGILYQGHILERERAFRGLRRGMPWGLLMRGVADLLQYNLRHGGRAATSLEAAIHARRGALFTRIFSQEFDERFKGIPWSQLPAPQKTERRSLWRRFMSDATKSLQMQETWHHPAAGTGQIIDKLEAEIIQMGGQIHFGCQVTQIVQAAGAVTGVTLLQDGMPSQLPATTLISSLPLQLLAPLIGMDIAPSQAELSFRRGVILVYLFLNRPPAFPHTSIHVSCPVTTMARITNYGALGGRMVPAGRGCLCIEYFTAQAETLLTQPDAEIFAFALGECLRSGLLKPDECIDHLVLRSANADPATSWEDYNTDPSRRAIHECISEIPNLYQINRTGTDKSTYAGLMATKAILAHDRALFDRATRPDVNRPWES